MAERSRVKRYENLRRKIADLSYFSLERSKTEETAVYTPDPDPDKAPRPTTSSAVRHNTITVPIAQILEESDRERGVATQRTQHFKALDETDHPVRGRIVGLRPSRRLPRHWWIWLLAILGCLAVAGAIIAVAIVFAP